MASPVDYRIMYFQSRAQAGKLLAEQMAPKLSRVNSSVIALSEEAAVVGEEIAAVIHASLLLLSVEEISLPGEPTPISGLSQGGAQTFNTFYSPSEIEAISGEYSGYLQEARLHKFHDLNRANADTEISPKLLERHVVILVSDGLKEPFKLDVAADFLKPFAIKQLIVATPLASVKALDRMHVLADQLFCLDIVENYLDTDHYYEDNSMPTHEELVKKIQTITLKWVNKGN